MSSVEETKDNHLNSGRLLNLLSWQNRGLLLDITVFLVNVLLMWLLSPLFLSLIQYAVAEDPFALSMVFILLIAAAILMPAAAILKRRSFHKRRKRAGDDEGIGGCLFNPIFYFCLQIFIISAINSFIVYYILGLDDPGPEIFLTSLFILLAIAISNTFFVFRYFTPPKETRNNSFLGSYKADSLGDICIFANMLIYQLAWNLMTAGEIFAPVSSVSEFIGRMFFLTFLAFLIYFPPRIFYLFEDANKLRTWLMIFVANSPVIFRVLFGGVY